MTETEIKNATAVELLARWYELDEQEKAIWREQEMISEERERRQEELRKEQEHEQVQ